MNYQTMILFLFLLSRGTVNGGIIDIFIDQNKVGAILREPEQQKPIFKYNHADGFLDENFSFAVSPNNFELAKPTWGPAFAIEFSVIFHALPEEGEAQNLVQFISADERLENENAGTSLPTIQILNIDGTATMGIQLSTGLDGEDTKSVFFKGLEEEVFYKVYMTLTNLEDEDDIHINGEFIATINNEPTTPDNILVKTLIVYNNLGIFAGNGDHPADATINSLKINNIFEPVSLQSGTENSNVGRVIGTAASWTDVYQTTLDASIDELPDQKGNIANLFSLITSKVPSPKVADLYSEDISDYDAASSELPSVNVKTLDDGSNEWCLYKDAHSSDCDLTLGIQTEKLNASVTLSQLKVKNEQEEYEYQLSCQINGQSLTNPKDGSNYVVVEDAKTFDNVKYSLATPSFSNNKVEDIDYNYIYDNVYYVFRNYKKSRKPARKTKKPSKKTKKPSNKTKKAKNVKGLFDIIGTAVDVATTVGSIGSAVLGAVA